MSDSLWDDPRITAKVLGELSPEQAAEFDQELERNPELRAAVQQARQLIGELESFYRDQPPLELSGDRRALVHDAMSNSVPAVAESSFPWRGVLALAATLLLLVILPLGLWVRQRETALITTENVMVDRQVAAMAEASGAPAAEEEHPAARAERVLATTGRSRLQSASGESEAVAESTFSQPSPIAAAAPAPIVADPQGIAAAPPLPGPDAYDSSAAKPTRAAVPSPAPLPPALKRVTRPGAPDAKDYGSSAGGYGLPRDTVDSVDGLGLATEEARAATDSAALSGRPFGVGGGMAGGRDPAPLEPQTKLVEPPATDAGIGPGQAGDRFDRITDNPFVSVTESPLSTFSIDVDTASYSKVRQYLLELNQLPRPDAVRIEELVNYFDYEYAGPDDDQHPLRMHVALSDCPWESKHRLARVAVKGKELKSERPRANLVFLLDVSGSMDQPNKLPLVIRAMRMLVGQMDHQDRIAIVVYAGAAGLVLDSTPGEQQSKILDALDRLQAGGSTNGGQGIDLAYATALSHFIEGGTNRVILCTDGDFNVGTTGTDALIRMVEERAKDRIFLSVLGFGMGNHNDAMLEQISGRGNGNYAFIDSVAEARKVLVTQLAGTLVTIAKDVKIQIEFNPAKFSAYRLIGYENRVLAAQDFNDDKKDAGEIGAGHEVTALYELVPADVEPAAAAPPVDPLKYQASREPAAAGAAAADEWMTVKLRYKLPEGDTSTLLEQAFDGKPIDFDASDDDFRFAAAVAGFGMQLRNSPYKGKWEWADIRQTAVQALGNDRSGLRSEFLELIGLAARQ